MKAASKSCLVRAGMVLTSGRFAFTLVELMVVMSILGILTLLSLAGVSSVREKINTAKCISNLRTTGLAIISHAADNDGRSVVAYIPPSASGYVGHPQAGYMWHIYLRQAGYLSDYKTVVCPSFNPNHWDESFPMRAYGLRKNPSPNHYEPAFVMSKVEHPSSFVVLADSSKPGVWEGQQYYLEQKYSPTDKIHTRHYSRANIFFADGSVRSLGAQEIVELGDDWLASTIDTNVYSKK